MAGTGYRSGRRTGLLALAILSVLAVAGFLFMTTGIARVSGDTNNVVSAALVNSGARQSMWRLPSGSIIAVIDLEGEFEILCHNGKRDRWGYVTPTFSTRIVVRSDKGCVAITDER